MALALTFEQSNSGKTFTITDASDDGTNLAGAHLTIVYNSETVYDADLGVDWATPGDESIDLTSSDLGQGADAHIKDGVYTITYSVDDSGVEDVTYNTLLNYNVKYCVYNILKQLPDVHAANDLCTKPEVQQATAMHTFLKSLEYSAACGQTNEIRTILAMLQKLCLNPKINECYCN